MGRRASSGLNATAIVGIVVVVLVVVAAGALIMRKGKSEGFKGDPYPVAESFKNAAALRRNDYVIEGVVYRIENRDTGIGVCLMVESDGKEEPVFVVVPEDVADINIERDIAYAFKVYVGEGGVNIATAVKRP